MNKGLSWKIKGETDGLIGVKDGSSLAEKRRRGDTEKLQQLTVKQHGFSETKKN